MKQNVLNFRFENKKDFYVTSKNSLAFELIQKWPNWNNQFFFLYGPSKCGKTTICKIWQKKSKTYKDHTGSLIPFYNNDSFKKFVRILVSFLSKLKSPVMIVVMFGTNRQSRSSTTCDKGQPLDRYTRIN